MFDWLFLPVTGPRDFNLDLGKTTERQNDGTVKRRNGNTTELCFTFRRLERTCPTESIAHLHVTFVLFRNAASKPFTRKDQIIDLLDAATQKHDVISHFIIAAWNYLLDNALRVWNPEIKSAILRRRRTSRARSTPAFWMAHSVWGLILVVLIPSYSLCRSPKRSVQVCIGLHRSDTGLERVRSRCAQVCTGL